MPRPQLGTAGAPLNSRPQKAFTGSGRGRLPECAPATRMHLICADRVAFNRCFSLLLRRKRHFGSRLRSLFQQDCEPVLVQNRNFQLHRLVVFRSWIVTHNDE
jgi:hypothetical protein